MRKKRKKEKNILACVFIYIIEKLNNYIKVYMCFDFYNFKHGVL